MNAFISWTGVDRDVKNAIVEKLQAEHINCYDSDEFCVSDFSADCIAAIENSSVFIVLVSDASMETGYVKNEVVKARELESQGKLNILVYKLTDKPYNHFFQFQLNHISFVTGSFIQRSESGASAIDTIVKRAKRLLELREKGEPEQPFDVFQPQIEGMEIVSPGYFVENSRDASLSAIADAFTRSNVVVLKELFGYGKRATIKKYAQLHAREYQKQIIVHNDNASLREFFLVGLQFSNINPKLFESLEGDALIRKKIDFLKKLDSRTLLVICDVCFEAMPNTTLFEELKSLKCHVMIITQESADQYRDWFPIVELGRMEDRYLKELFFHHYDCATEEDQQALDEPLTQFLEDVGGHTKTVELTASVLCQEWGVPPEQIPECLKMRSGEGLQLKERILHQLTYLLNPEKFSDDECIALLVAAYVAAPSISDKKYRNILEDCGVTHWPLVIGLHKRRWLDVDIRNGTVSVEPLIAQVIISKLREDHSIAQCCLENLEQNYNQTAWSGNAAVSAREMERLAALLDCTGYEEAGRITRLLRQLLVDSESSVSAPMKAAIADFEQRCATDALQIEDPEFTSEYAYRERVEDFIRRNLLPLAKTVASEISLFHIDPSLAFAPAQTEDLFLEQYEEMGMTREELYTMLTEMRAAMEDNEDFDEEDSLYMVLMETFAATDAFYRRDLNTMMANIQSVINHITQQPQLMEEPTLATQVYVVVQLMALVLGRMGATSNAIRLCEDVLKIDSDLPQRNVVTKLYIQLLEYCDQYTDALFDAYEDAITCFAANAGSTYDSREEKLAEEKLLLLQYAYALAKGKRLEKAETVFADAEKRGEQRKVPDTIKTVLCITEGWIHTGEFDKATAFAARYLEKKSPAFFLKNGISPDDNDLSYLRSLREAWLNSDEEQITDPRQYENYYQQFAREKNRLVDRKYYDVAEKAMGFDFSHLTNEEIAQHAAKLKEKAKRMKPLALAPEAFALVSEAGLRTLGYKHHKVQYVGAAAMVDGKVAEILNGEGKTYTVVPVAFLNYLYGHKVLVVDSSAYLTKRNHNWMAGIYRMLGMSTEHITHYTQVYKKKAGQQQDVSYINLRALMFGFLYSELETDFRREFMRYDCAIIDEIDSVLVDDAETSYQASTSVSQGILPVRNYSKIYELARQVMGDSDCYTLHKGTVTLSPAMSGLIERAFRVSYSDIGALEQIRQIEQNLRIALRCLEDYEEGKDYHIFQGEPTWENKAKGIFEKFSPQFAYFLCRKHDLDATEALQALNKQVTISNMISVRDMFLKFKTVCGTTATAISFKKEFQEIYGLDYVAIPPHKPCVRSDYKLPLYVSMAEKDRAILELILEKHQRQQPVLLVCQDVGESEKYAAMLSYIRLPHRVLNARNTEDSTDLLACAGEKGSILITTFLVNRGVDIKLGGDAELLTRRELVEQGMDVTLLDQFFYTRVAPGPEHEALFKKYHSVLEKNRTLTASKKEQVIAAGGLCVIATSFFADSRIEQQTRGRSGRQGDVGESHVFWSADDEIIETMLSSDLMQGMLKSMEDMEVATLDNKVLQLTYQNTQRILHNQKFDRIRKQNNTSTHLEAHRAAFMGAKLDLAEGKLDLEGLCRMWAEHKTTLENLKRLRTENNADCGPVLDHLRKKHPELLTDRRAERQLAALLAEDILAYLQEQKLPAEEVTRVISQRRLLSGWEKLIPVVIHCVEDGNMTANLLKKHLQAEKDRLLHETLDGILSSLLSVRRK